MSVSRAIPFMLSAFCVVSAVVPCQADQLRLPEEIGRTEAPRDTNMFQLEPTVLDERYYTSGRAERHQNVGMTLPAGSPIPDSDWPVASLPASQAPNTVRTTQQTQTTSHVGASSQIIVPNDSVYIHPATRLVPNTSSQTEVKTETTTTEKSAK